MTSFLTNQTIALLPRRQAGWMAFVTLTLTLLMGLLPAPAVAEEVTAIQNRLFDRDHEVGLLLGYVPNDQFHEPVPLGAQYTFNFDELLAWEVVRAQYFFNSEKDLKNDLEQNFGVTPTKLDWLQYSVHSHLVIKPTYGKDALWNRKIINHETYLAVGGGVVRYESESSQGEQGGETAFSLSFGIGRRYFISPNLCLSLEVRDLLNFRDEDLENRVYLGIGLGFRFNLKPRQATADDSAERLRGYLGGGGNDG